MTLAWLGYRMLTCFGARQPLNLNYSYHKILFLPSSFNVFETQNYAFKMLIINVRLLSIREKLTTYK